MSRNLIIEKRPNCFIAHGNTIIKTTVFYRPNGGTRNSSFEQNFIIKEKNPNNSLVVGKLPSRELTYASDDVTVFEKNQSEQKTDEKTISGFFRNSPCKDRNFIFPPTLFFNFLDEYFYTSLLGVMGFDGHPRPSRGQNVVFKKLKVSFFNDVDSLQAYNEGQVTSTTALRQKNFFTFANGIIGEAPEDEVRVGGLSFSLYPDPEVAAEGENNSVPSNGYEGLIEDRPGRLILRGVAVKPSELYTNNNLKKIVKALSEPIPFGARQAFVLQPVVSVLGGVFPVRAVQISGYVKVAGQGDIIPGSLVVKGNEEGR